MEEDFLGAFDLGPEETPPAMPVVIEPISMSTLNEWGSWLKPFPLPPQHTPTEPMDWSEIRDEDIMVAPPHLLAHLQRTAAQSGLQVISPRQTPFSALMGRTRDSKRSVSDYVVGSVASLDTEWPTIDGASFENLLPDEPLPEKVVTRGMRKKTKTEPLTSAGHMLRDPILSCLITGRAVIDIVRRDDVAGDGDGLSNLIADAWGVPPADFNDLDAFTLGLDGPLLRHCLKSDEVYPMMYAPIHQKMCISVSNSDINRQLLPEDTTMDWRRMRVFCEAVFSMCCAIEGIPLTAVRASPPPGDPSAPLSRPSILAFRPLPCTAWSFEARSFSIWPVCREPTGPKKTIPTEVILALSKYVREVRPMSYALTTGTKMTARQSTVVAVVPVLGETIKEAYGNIVTTVATGPVRGKTAAATVRHLVYTILGELPLGKRLRIARYMKLAKEECYVHMGVDVPPDRMVDRLAVRFLVVGESLRVKVVAEAARRGATADEWWEDITSQVPARYQSLKEGSMSWAKVAMWLVFREPTDKWRKLCSAVNYSALRAAAVGEVGAIALPPERGSIERVLAVARAVAKRSTRSYSEYYMAVSDVGLALSDEIMDTGRERTAMVLREASYLWVLRARALRGTNVASISKNKKTPKANHLRVDFTGFDLLVVPAPYTAFEAYREHVRGSALIHKRYKQDLLLFDEDKISDAFKDMKSPLAPAKESTLTRFLTAPHKLARAMEKAWRETTDDIREALTRHAAKDKPHVSKKQKTEETGGIGSEVDMTKILKTVRKTGNKYVNLLLEAETDEVDWFEDALVTMTPQEALDMQDRVYTGLVDMRDQFLAVMDKYVVRELAKRETVM